MFIPKLNLECVFKYPFHSGKKLPLVECFERNKIAHFFVCLATTDQPSKFSLALDNCQGFC